MISQHKDLTRPNKKLTNKWWQKYATIALEFFLRDRFSDTHVTRWSSALLLSDHHSVQYTEHSGQTHSECSSRFILCLFPPQSLQIGFNRLGSAPTWFMTSQTATGLRERCINSKVCIFLIYVTWTFCNLDMYLTSISSVIYDVHNVVDRDWKMEKRCKAAGVVCMWVCVFVCVCVRVFTN